MRNITQLRRHAKALSPIFATLILIAITVIAGIVVYMFASGYIATMTGGGTVGQEKIAIQSASVSTTTLTLYVQAISGTPIVTGLIVKDSSGNFVQSVTSGITPATAVPMGQLTAVTATITALTSGSTYTVTLTTKAGNSFVSPTFTA